MSAALVVHTRGPAGTLRLAGALGAVLARAEERVIVGLSGEMGAGKTTLVRGLVAALPQGASAAVASPTWSLANVYPTQPVVAHVDAWRLDAGADLGPLGLETLPANAIVVVEWIANVPELLDSASLLVTIAVSGVYARTVHIEACSASGAVLLEKLSVLRAAGTAR